MTLSQAIYETLSTAMEGTIAEGRVYPVAGAPKAGLPRITYMRVGGVREATVGGSTASHARGRYRVMAYAATQIDAEALILAIVDRARVVPQPAPIRVLDLETGPYDIPEDVAGAELQTAVCAVDLGVTYKEH